MGVHSPEFAFEHDVGNVADQAAALGVHYPVAIDNDFRTWRAYDQRYWPAHYLIDRSGRVRQVHYGEGAYAQTEALIRQLLGEGAGGAQGSAGHLEHAGAGRRRAPRPRPPRRYRRTPETYLGYARAAAYANADLARDRSHTYQAPAMLEPDLVALDGSWRLESERITAGQQARLRLHYTRGQGVPRPGRDRDRPSRRRRVAAQDGAGLRCAHPVPDRGRPTAGRACSTWRSPPGSPPTPSPSAEPSGRGRGGGHQSGRHGWRTYSRGSHGSHDTPPRPQGATNVTLDPKDHDRDGRAPCWPSAASPAATTTPRRPPPAPRHRRAR